MVQIGLYMQKERKNPHQGATELDKYVRARDQWDEADVQGRVCDGLVL
jgi:hypothetical protein